MIKQIAALTFFFSLCLHQVTAQEISAPASTPAKERIASFQQRQALLDRSLVNEIPFRSIGPTVFSGRVADIDVSPEDPSHFYVAYASGGLWKTENNGTSFQPLFDREIVMTLGDIAVNWEENIIWAGTGEVNSSRSSYAGVGMYKSTDNGKTWKHKGLEESHHIGRIILHPNDPNTLWVAVLGHLYSPNKERGIYKTTDGGASWQQVLFVNENAGAVDLIIDPQNPDILYAATWERTRRSWNFTESGAGSGIYKSDDGGASWTLLSNKKSGFPTGEGVGRIGLTAVEQDGSTILYAILDNYNRRPAEDKEEEKEGLLTKDQIRNMSSEDFLQRSEKEITAYLKEYQFPEKYDAAKVIEMVRNNEIQPKVLVEYVEDANRLLFDTPVIGAEVYRSDDGGKKWEKQNEDYLDRVYNSYGYYFGQIRVAPQDPDRIYIMGVPVLRSYDAGKTWTSINGDNVHGDHHALWVNPEREGHLLLGNDGGINISYDDGDTWIKCNSPAVGQFYAVEVDMAEPYRVYGGLQDNGVWVGPSDYEYSNRWHNTGDYPYDLLIGGDGMEIEVDTRDNQTVYTGYQFGNYFRIDRSNDKPKYITPKHELGERPLRWNWQSPIHLSIHNQDILYMGSNKLHRSFNRGDSFQTISDDLTKGGKKGDVPYGTLTSIHESPLRFGLLYTGSDDGLVHVTTDGGNSWNRISKGLPENMWVSKVMASAHQENRVYVSLNGYRWDDFRSLVYVSEDYGNTWKQIGKDLPLEPVNVVYEDPTNADLLYVGTDHGLYVSLDRGRSFMLLQSTMPAAPVHDVLVHPRDHELLVGTHGRSLYIGDVSHLQLLKTPRLKEELIVFERKAIPYRSNWGKSYANWMKAEDPEVFLPCYLKEAGEVTIEILADDNILKEWTYSGKKGLNYIPYHLDVQNVTDYEKWLSEASENSVELKQADTGKIYLQPGDYIVRITKGKISTEEQLSIRS
jgi:photosystem II stability/assembly factor-like uncharacterized protein